MPDYICSECEETFFERSDMPLFSPCQNCGAEDTVSLYTEEPEPPELHTHVEDPRVEARAAAEAVLAEREITTPPVDVIAIAEALGLEIAYAALGEIDGELREGRIRVNEEHHRVRQRFTIAHELGHHRLHTVHGERSQQVERQADAFAAALLMPPSMLRVAVAENPDFHHLRCLFEVSRQALTIALGHARLTSQVEIPQP